MAVAVMPGNVGETRHEARERRVRARGEALLAALRREEGRSGSDWLYGRLMRLATRDEDLKVQLFRFVDALPALPSGEAVAQHLREYLLRPDLALPPGARALIALLERAAPTRRL